MLGETLAEDQDKNKVKACTSFTSVQLCSLNTDTCFNKTYAYNE
jgi:hypothetical protein